VGGKEEIMSDNFGRMTSDEAPQSLKDLNVRLMAAAPSMYDALCAIANMQIQEETDKGEVLALCMSIARIELEKCSGVLRKKG
jgi:hypothetical protein